MGKRGLSQDQDSGIKFCDQDLSDRPNNWQPYSITLHSSWNNIPLPRANTDFLLLHSLGTVVNTWKGICDF